MSHCSCCVVHFFFFNDTATTEIYTLSLHDALPIYLRPVPARRVRDRADACHGGDRTSSGEGGARPAAAPAVDRGHGDGGCACHRGRHHHPARSAGASPHRDPAAPWGRGPFDAAARDCASRHGNGGREIGRAHV